MFNSISWELFLTAAALLMGGYYSITSLMLYYREIAHWVKSLSHPNTPSSPFTSAEQQHNTTSIMGNASPDAERTAIRSSELSAEEITTSGSEEQPEVVNSSSVKDDLLIGTVADLLQEIKTLIQLIAEYGTGKSESRALFNALFIRYPHLQNTSYPQAISFYICDTSKGLFSFELSVEETLSWWNPVADSAKQ
jgi:hypothetical protein